MKKSILSIALLFTLAFVYADEKETKAAAKSGVVAENVLRQFGYNFYNATDVKWNITEKFQSASFKLDEKLSYAIFSKDNEFLVATQLVALEELPTGSLDNISKSYGEVKFLKTVKIISRPASFQYKDDTGSYWASVLKGDKQLILLISPDADVTMVKTLKL